MTKYQALAVVIFVLFIMPLILIGYTIVITGGGFSRNQIGVAFIFALVGFFAIGGMLIEGLLKGGDK